VVAVPYSFVILLYIKDKVRMHPSMRLPLLILVLYFVYAVIIVNDAEDLTYIVYRLERFMLAFLLLNYIVYKKISFIDELRCVLMIFVVQGIFNFIFSNYFSFLFSPITDRLGVSMFGRFLCFFTHQEMDMYDLGLPVLFIRNIGMFWEPGVFHIFLNIFIFINLFLIKNTTIVWNIIASILIFTTVSTTGYVVLFCQLVFFYFVFKKIYRKTITSLLIAIPLICGIYYLVEMNVDNKISGTHEGSFDARFYDTVNGIYILFDNPLGIGFSTEKYMKIATLNQYNIDTGVLATRQAGNTNSIVTLFYTTGFIWGILFMIFMYKQKLLLQSRCTLLFFGILLVCLASEPLFFSPFFLLFPLSGMMQNNIISFKFYK
jgi:hypothetical protein